MPEEFLMMINECTRVLSLEVVLDRRQSRDVWDKSPEALLASPRIYLAETLGSGTEPLGSVNPARLGWVMAEVPAIEENRLFAI